MNEAQLKEYLKNHLKIKMTTKSGQYGFSGSVRVSLYLDDEEINSDGVSGSDIENTQSDNHYE